ncbi:MAG: hypothetical protein ACLFSZ_07570 [Puniceicoccaceae bacterium]
MLYVSAAWGILGVLGILGFAVWRLFPLAVGAFAAAPFGVLEWVVFAGWLLFMTFAEGVKGFHRGFSPRVVARARALLERPRFWPCLLAPFYCFGFFHATRKRMIVSWSVAGGVLGLVLLVRLLPQPWRGIIDAGVVAGLGVGMGSILYYSARWLAARPVDYPADLPEADTGAEPASGGG